MATNISSSVVKMNDAELGDSAPLTQATFNKVGANINGLIDLFDGVNAIEFLANTTWTCPSNINRVLVTGCGGGSGGYSSSSNGNFSGMPAPYSSRLASVTPGAKYTIAIGVGGAGGSGGTGTNGGAGSATTFTDLSSNLLASLPGGAGYGGSGVAPTGPFGAGVNSGAGGGIGGAGSSGRLMLTFVLSRP